MLILATPADVCNAAIARLGGKKRVGTLFDGTDVSRLFLDIYGQTRDALLRAGDYEFAIAIAAAVAAAGAPPPGWKYQFAYPADALRIRSVFDAAAFAGDPNNPVPVDWRVGSGMNAGIAAEIVLTQTAAVTLVYTKQITDPLLWDAGFQEAFVATLADKASMEPNAGKILETEEAEAVRTAQTVQG